VAPRAFLFSTTQRAVLLVCFGTFFNCLGVVGVAQEPESSTSSTALSIGEAALDRPEGNPHLDPTPQTVRSESAAAGKDEEQTPEDRHGSFIVAPLPVSSPAIGTGIVPILGYIFPFNKNDKISPPSTVAGAGLVTNNGSRAFALGAQLFFRQNRYKVTAAYARGNLNYDLYGPGLFSSSGTKLPLQQTGQLFLGELLRRIQWDFLLGPRFFSGSSTITLSASNPSTVTVPPDLGLQTNLRSIGFRLQRDTRPNHFYPVRGTFTDFTGDFFARALGSKYSFQSYNLTFNKYLSITPNQVFAFGSFFCGTAGQPPFYGNCIYGSRNQLRGYTAGRYFDRYQIASQFEYRLSLPMRLGLVAFGGAGGVIPGKEQFLVRNRYFLPSGGLGLRFRLSSKYHVNLRADLAQGKDGHVFSMGVGEAF
jgi:hypothetical protein